VTNHADLLVLPDDGWRRLHPLSPVARIGRLIPALLLLLVVQTAHSKVENRTAETDYLIILALLSIVYGYIHWMVTRWRIEGDTLRIETGLIRKDSRRLPLARIQAVDLVRPLLARMLGVAELRVRLAGSGSTDGKLAFLGMGEATELRLALLAGIIWRRLSGQYSFMAVEGPEGVRITRGLLATISETVPYGRIQAVRQVEPLLWRPFHWCRLEVDIAGATARNQRGEGTSVVRKALLPVGTGQDAWHLLARLLGAPDPVRTPPPRRARLKAPLSFHFLSAGYDDTHAMCVTGRLNRTTTWVPFEKTQSIRRVQGPLQRPLGLATVHVDVAGKRTRAQFRDRPQEEAERLVEQLTALSRTARHVRRPAPASSADGDGQAVPSGWYPDPSGRHEHRYWHGGRWTEQVSNGGRRTSEAVTSPR